MKKIEQKHLLDTFSEKLNTNFSTYCDKYGQEKDIHRFITYILDHGLIPPSAIRKYTVKEIFDELQHRHEGNKTQVVNLIAERFNLSARSIWNLLKKR